MSDHFGNRLDHILKERGIGPTKITRELGISRQSLYNWLSGGNISPANAGRLANYLGINRLWLLEGVGTPSSNSTTYGQQAQTLIKDVINSEVRLKLAAQAAGLSIWEYRVIDDSLNWAGESLPLCGIDLASSYRDLDGFIGDLDRNDRETFRNTLKNLLTKTGQSHNELTIHLPDGRHRNIAVWMTTIKDAVGRPLGITGAIQDITERIQNQSALSESEHRFRALAEQCPFGIGMAQNTQTIYANQAYLDIFGFNCVDDLYGKSISEQIAPDSRNDVIQKIRDRAAGKQVPNRYETEGIRENGETFPLQVDATVLQFPDGPVNIGFFRDLSELKISDAAIRERELQLKKAQEIAALGKWELDTNTLQCRLSESALEIFGFSSGSTHNPEELLKKIHPEDRDQWLLSFNSAISGEQEYDVHYRVIKANGDIRHLHAKAELVWDNSGEPTRMFGIVQDVTAQQLREKRLTRLNRTHEMMRSCSKSLVRADNEKQMLNEFCNNIVSTGGYPLAWVGCMKEDENRSIEPVAIAGSDAGYVGKAQHTWADTPQGQGPGGRTIRSGKPTIIHSTSSDSSFQPWREAAIEQGYHSVVGLPLTNEGNACGVLLIYAGETNAFDSEELQLLETLAEDLSYGVHALRAKQERDAAEKELAKSEQRFKDFTLSASDWFWESGPGLEFTFLSDQFFESTGISKDRVIGKRCEDLSQFDPQDNNMLQHLQELEQRLPFRNFQFWHQSENGRHLCTRMSGIPKFDDSGEFLGYRGTAANVTQEMNAEEELRLAATVFGCTLEGVMVTDLNGTIISVNRAFSEITGYSEKEALGQNPSLLKSERHNQTFYDNIWATVAAKGQWSGEIWNRRKSGEVYPEWLAISSVRDSQGAISRYVGVFSDTTAMKQSEEHLFHLAHHDPLTNLPNRLMFTALMEHTLERVERNGEQIAVLFLDLDLFKNINDSFGHPIGDQILQRLAERLSEAIRDEDTIARLSGDEFILLIERVGDMESAAKVAEKLLHELTTAFHINDQALYVGASIGISISPNDGINCDELIKNAEAAMYRAKHQGRGSYCFYTEELTVSAMERVVLERELRQALEKGQMIVHYQPQYSLKSGKLVGAEALVRWQHPEKGLIPPDSFIPIAEECGLILPLGDWVLQESSRQMCEWIEEGMTIDHISVNVSGKQVERTDLVASVRQILEETGLKPSQLELEITESCIMQEPEPAIRALEELKTMGVRLAVDDFGTGYSSLSYLKQLPIHKLKIDRSFIRDIPDDPNDEAISRAILALGHSLQLEIIAEGVETTVQEQFLKKEGCDEVQGYLYSRPVTAEVFKASLLSNS